MARLLIDNSENYISTVITMLEIWANNISSTFEYFINKVTHEFLISYNLFEY